MLLLCLYTPYNIFVKIFGLTSSELRRQGAFHTAGEIRQQPGIWSSVYELILGKRKEILQFMNDNGRIVDRVIITGAGTSAFIGISLEHDFEKQWGIPSRAVATTDLVTHPNSYFNKKEKVLLVSFARSGNSPESVGAVELAESLSAGVVHLIITCDAAGRLASARAGFHRYLLVLPEETNDRSLAMTSSYTGMMLAGLLISRIRAIDLEARHVAGLIAGGTRVLEEYVPALKELASRDFDRAVFLGSGPQAGTATESQLKLQELTDGHVICKADSYLGFRHGPKAVTNPSTLMVYLFSNVPYVLEYETDLVFSMDKGRGTLFQVGVMESPGQEKELSGKLDLEIHLSPEPLGLDEEYLAICNVLPAQLLGLLKSLHLGLRPDNPSVSGAISRVVEGVKIYPYG
jgi:tagatose-6-phosphate ketose/aldose isomerase